ncbi:hypothetical protein LOTGIDRAFT_200139 [Lottia gigantea]|uniref:Transport and Golgi organization protein 2 homolog n=1 Tax=Lottia gigantea TaxID=225164 RepID=V4ACJ8_LOTGI|nr:hypothetical protein LOTGIDRAFT_200139 [Lottia gigantea]ESP01734.1 hypothetical protein LOTGIDRAFT_200139 [Lottia gigantea]
MRKSKELYTVLWKSEMCILFLYVNNEYQPDEFQLILVNNRDETWDRPTKLADFWSTNKDCISGLDNEPGKEGGTWLGLNKNGRIGILLNIPNNFRENMKGRGYLVSNYLTSQDSPKSFIKNIEDMKSDYNGFHLALLHKSNGKFDMEYLTNGSGNAQLSKINKGQYTCIGNSYYDKPWKKIIDGREPFQNIIHKYSNHKDKLIDELLNFMFDKKQYYPDDVLYNQTKNIYARDYIEQLACRYVWLPKYKYGTRTTTIVLIDGQGCCDYIEKTLVTPVDVENPQFTTKSFHFQLSNTI